MKIAFAYTTFSDTGGVERASRDLAASLARRGHPIDFHCAEVRAEAEEGITLHRHRVPAWPHALQIAAFARAASAGISRTPVDIVHAHGVFMGADVITAQSCHRAGLAAQKLIPGSSSRPGRNLGLSDAVRLHQFRALLQKLLPPEHRPNRTTIAARFSRFTRKCWPVPTSDRCEDALRLTLPW